MICTCFHDTTNSRTRKELGVLIAYRLHVAAETAHRTGESSPFLRSSDLDRAWRLGLMFRTAGKPCPATLKPSRGHTWKVDGHLYSFRGDELRPARVG